MGGSAPKADKNIGIAALKSAELGESVFEWMRGQAEVTNDWAAEDRERQQSVFIPLQDEYISEAQNWDSPERKQAAASQAVADTRLQTRIAQGANDRRMMAMGVNPASGRALSANSKASLDGGLAAMGAGNLARRQVEGEADAKRANAINLGSGLAVNPATSMGLSNSAVGSGGQTAMQGYNQQGSLLNTQYQQQLQGWQASNSNIASLFGGLGSLAGLAFSSSKKLKTDKTAIPEGKALGAVRDMPVEEWTYRPGVEDGGRHIGPYAEDFQRATGKGDGKSIPAQDAIGLALGAVRDLDSKIDKLAANLTGGPKRKAVA